MKNMDDKLNEALDNPGLNEADAELSGLLGAAGRVKHAYAVTPDGAKKRAALARFNRARVEASQKRADSKPFFRFNLRRLAWAVSTVAVLAVVAAITLRPAPLPVTLVSADPQGNMAFAISDDIGAIGDFTSVKLSIDRVGLKSADNKIGWIEFEPEITEVELTQLMGEASQTIWQGNVPDSDYELVYISVDQATGNLKDGGQSVNLGSQRLNLEQSFQVISDGLTSFTYDVTVVADAQAGHGYALSPQPEESGARHQHAAQEQNDNGNPEPGQGQQPEQQQQNEEQEQNQYQEEEQNQTQQQAQAGEENGDGEQGQGGQGESNSDNGQQPEGAGPTDTPGNGEPQSQTSPPTGTAAPPETTTGPDEAPGQSPDGAGESQTPPETTGDGPGPGAPASKPPGSTNSAASITPPGSTAGGHSGQS